MDPSSIQQIIVVLLLLILSAFFSSAETALTTVNKHRIRALSQQGDRRASRVLALIEKPEKMLSAILIGNNIVNLSASSLNTTLAIRLAQHAGFGKNSSTFIGVATGILTFLILIFGEITPKTIATKKSENMSLAYSGIIYAITTVLTPIIFVVNFFSGFICRLFGIKPGDGQTMTEMELRTIVDVSQESGVIEQEEKELINNVFDFGDSVAKDIMLPRIDVSFASVDMSYDELVGIFLEEQYSRLPVYEESKDNVIGILNLKDMFFYRETHKNEKFDIYKVMREPFFTYEYQKTSTLMEEMRNNSISFAIVLDEYGSTAGLITLEDLIEEIVGDIKDEFDASETDAIRCIGTDEYEIEGSTKLDDLNDVLDTEIESEDYDSIGGHMIELLDHLPKEGETVKEGNYLYSIKKMDKNRVEIVYLKIDRQLTQIETQESETV
ncbi:MAG: hemolysin family protein [Eubacterium sp.]|nr:hemolysin family protein [Eubacterium sp.]MDD7209269.1 hemolysin family protein [Lachnospiraceae bacterium]